jgi:hypothetical protein
MPHAYAADATEPWQSRDAVPTLEAQEPWVRRLCGRTNREWLDHQGRYLPAQVAIWPFWSSYATLGAGISRDGWPALRTDVARQVGAGEVALDLPTPDGGERDHGAARSGCPQRDLAQGARHTETARGRAGRDGSGDRNAAAVADGGDRAGSDRAAEFSRVQSATFGAECPPIGARVPATPMVPNGP